jgi:hypothetical protein
MRDLKAPKGIAWGKMRPLERGRFTSRKSQTVNTIIYSDLLKENIRIVSDDLPFAAVEGGEVIYTESEIMALKGKGQDMIHSSTRVI